QWSSLFRKAQMPFWLQSRGVASGELSRQKPEGSRPTAFISYFSISICHSPIIEERRKLRGEVREFAAFSWKSGRLTCFNHANIAEAKEIDCCGSLSSSACLIVV